MKKILSAVFLTAMMLLNTVSVFADDIYVEEEALTPPDLKAESAMLLDLKTGRIIYSKNPDKKVYPASTTKILTGIMALENGNLQDTVTASVAALAPITNEDSHMGILIDEVLTMEQLINGMLVYSANDAANVIATHIGGTTDQFVEMMNQKAEEIGVTNTNFTNAYGIHDDNHYTTAEDIAMIAQYAMQNEQFREIVKKSSYTIPATNKNEERILPATNLFLGTARSFKYQNDRITGIKTGFTSAAGYCLVSSAVEGDTELMAVVMKAPNQETCYTNTNDLLDFGFDNYKYQPIVKAGEVITDSKVIEAKEDKRVAFTVESDLSALLPSEADFSEEIETVIDIPENLRAPIKKGEAIGSVSYNYKGTLIGHASLIATNDVERNIPLYIFNMIMSILTFPFFYIPAIFLIIFFIIMRIHSRKQDRIKRKRRLHEKQSDRIMRDGTRNPINQKYADTTNKRNPNSRYRRK